MKKTHETLCWRCQKAGGKCSWSSRFKPVEGWEAKPTKVKVNKSSKYANELDSFDVYECPEFELLERLKRK